MNYQELRSQMQDYYRNQCSLKAEHFREKVFSLLDKHRENHPDMNAYEMKSAQYKCIAEEAVPVFFDHIPFYFEMGTLDAYCDGCYQRGGIHANGWTLLRNYHLFEEADPHKWAILQRNHSDRLYMTCGPYIDLEHFPLPFEKIFADGLESVYLEALEAQKQCVSKEESDFVSCAITGILSLKKMADKFAETALAKAKTEQDTRQASLYAQIAKTAAKVPWQKPESVYEALCTIAFMRKALGSLEGVGFNSMGRMDVQLAGLYQKDLAKGITREEIYDYICKFMLIWDCHVDRSKIMQGYADYEYENSMVLGGCDENGNEVYNEITRMFLQAHMELDNMYPKIMCRYSSKSNEEYLSWINKPALRQQSILLYCNDDAIVPALDRHGFAPQHSKNYTVSGCWGIGLDNYYKRAVGYVNILKALEWGMHMPEADLAANELDFQGIADAENFEEVYRAVFHNILQIIGKKAELEAFGARVWSDVSPVCTFSALLMDPLKTKKDFSKGGTRYNWEVFNMAALPDTVDSLLAIKYLCFDEKLLTVRELIDACKNNWPDETLRKKALQAPGHGDGSEASSRLFGRLMDDIYTHTRNLPTSYGGQWQISCYMYTEIIWWGKEMSATPNGRRNGDYLTQGLTPSRLHTIKSVTDVFSGLRYFDSANLSGGSVINVVLPAAQINTALMNAFLRGCAQAGTHIMQINCVNRDDLLAAQKAPEEYGHIIVRVCGFSAPFVQLSEDFQKEFLSRNYYEM